MNQIIMIWRYVRCWIGVYFGSRLNREAVFKDARDVGKIVMGSGVLGFIVKDAEQGRYVLELVVGVIV